MKAKDVYLKIVSPILGWGVAEGAARCLNWSLMAILPLFLSSIEYGKVGLIVSVELLVANIVLLGMDRAVLRFYSNEEVSIDFLKSVFILWGCLALLPVCGVMLLAVCGVSSLFSVLLFPHLLLLSFAVSIYNLNLLCVCMARATRDLPRFYSFRVGYIALKFISIVVSVKVLGSCFGYVLGLGLSSMVILALNAPYLNNVVKGRYNYSLIKELVAFGWPFVFHVVSWNVLHYFSRFFLEKYNSLEDVGVFTFSFSVGSGLYIVFAVINTYYEPRIYSFSGDKAKREFLLLCVTVAGLFFSLIGGLVLLYVFPYIVTLVSGEYSGSLGVVAVVMASVFVQPLYLEGTMRLTVYSRTSLIAKSSFIAALLSVILCTMLVPSNGIFGAALSLFLSNCFLAICVIAVSLFIGKDNLINIKSRIFLYSSIVLGSIFIVVLRDSGCVKFILVVMLLSVVFVGVKYARHILWSLE